MSANQMETSSSGMTRIRTQAAGLGTHSSQTTYHRIGFTCPMPNLQVDCGLALIEN